MQDFFHYMSVYLITVVPLTAAIFVFFKFFLKMREWYASDGIMLIIPGAIYFLMEKMRPDKLIGIGMRMPDNIDSSIIIGILCSLTFLIRCFSAIKRREDAKKISYLSVIAMTILTIFVLIFAPPFTNQ
jgi:uncharacterized membrane protein